MFFYVQRRNGTVWDFHSITEVMCTVHLKKEEKKGLYLKMIKKYIYICFELLIKCDILNIDK